MKKLALGLALGLLLIVGTAGPAFAHATIDGSSPSAGQSVAASPSRVELRFSESVEVTLGGVRVYDSSGRRLDTGSPQHPGGAGNQVAVALPRLPNGSYVVTWRVVSADSHPVRGAFTFSVGPLASARDVSGLSARLLDRQDGSTAVGVALGVVRFLVFASLVVVVGGTVFLVFVWPSGRGRRRARALVWTAWGVALFATLAGIALQGPYAAALPLGDVLNPSLWADVLHTRFGRVWLARAALLGVGALLLRVLFATGAGPSRRLPAWWPAGAGLVGAWLIGTPAMSGHAGTGDLAAFTVAIDAVHVGAVALWLGGLAMLTVVFLLRVDAAELRDALSRFSPLALGALITITATGGARAWREVGSVHALLSTDYGHVLEVKLVAFAGLVAFAVVSHRIVREHFRSPLPSAPALVDAGGPGAAPDDEWTVADEEACRMGRLRQSVAAEVVVALLVIAVTAMLVNTAPARTAESGPYVATLKTPDLWFDVQISPTRRGANDLHVTIVDPAGGERGVQELSVHLELPARDIAPITVPLQRITSGHFISPGFDIPIAGSWRLTVTALLTDVDSVTATDTVSIQ